MSRKKTTRKKATRKKTGKKKRVARKKVAAAKPAASRKKRKRSAPTASGDIIAALQGSGVVYYDGAGFSASRSNAARYAAAKSPAVARSLLGKFRVKVIGVFSASASSDQIRGEFRSK